MAKLCAKGKAAAKRKFKVMLLTEDLMALIQNAEDQKVKREKIILNVYLCLK
jgi:hypothetical protein